MNYKSTAEYINSGRKIEMKNIKFYFLKDLRKNMVQIPTSAA